MKWSSISSLLANIFCPSCCPPCPSSTAGAEWQEEEAICWVLCAESSRGAPLLLPASLNRSGLTVLIGLRVKTLSCIDCALGIQPQSLLRRQGHGHQEILRALIEWGGTPTKLIWVLVPEGKHSVGNNSKSWTQVIEKEFYKSTNQKLILDCALTFWIPRQGGWRSQQNQFSSSCLDFPNI